MTALLLAAAMGATLFISWAITTQNDEQYATLKDRLEKLSTNISRLEGALEPLGEDIRQLHIAVGTNTKIDGRDQPARTQNQGAVDNLEGKETRKSNYLDSYSNNRAPVAVDAPKNKEMASVTLIVDKLRAHDLQAYPNILSLMSSPEMTVLSPEARNRIMAEVARMGIA